MRQEQPAELDRLDRRFRSALTAFFARRIRNRAEAEDLTQEVFTRLARHPRESGETPDAYVFSVAANLLSDRSRRESVSRRYRESEALSDDLRDVDPLDPFRIAAGRQELAQLARAIAELPEKTRRIFILYRIENIDKPTIAASFGLSTRMIEIHIRRALEALAARREQE